VHSELEKVGFQTRLLQRSPGLRYERQLGQPVARRQAFDGLHRPSALGQK